MMAFGASQLDVEVRYPDDLTLRVSDNGTGSTPLSRIVGRTDTSGLQGMRERTSRIEGKLTLGSSSNSGTEVRLVVPGGIIFRKGIRSTVFAY